MKFIGIGDNVCDKYVHQGIMYPGGQALNFSVYAHMLGHMASYMGVFGNDEVAKYIIQTLDGIGIEHKRCRQYPGENGYSKVTLIDGDRVFLGSNQGGIVKTHPLQLDEEDIEYLKCFSHIHTSNNSYIDSQLPKLREMNFSVSYDYSKQWAEEYKIKATAPYVDFGFISCSSFSDESAEKICQNLYQQGCGMVIATRGDEDPIFYDGEHLIRGKVKKVKAVDTLGAGDAFATGFLTFYITEKAKVPGLKKGSSAYVALIEKAMKNGAEFAARICMLTGAFGHGKKIQSAEI